MGLFHKRAARPVLPSKRKSAAIAAQASALFAIALAVTLTTSAANASTGLGSAFECGDVIGKVFEDKNRNGHQDKGEAGLPGVRLATVQGLLTVTDKHGRYHMTCAQIPRDGIGSVFLLKLDVRALPTGYRITTENPRAVRLTRGKVTKLNFGASRSRVVRLDLAGAAFVPSSTDLNPQWSAGIDQLITTLGQDHSTLRVVYEKGDEDKTLADERLRAVSQLVTQRWQQQDRPYPLEIERRMMTGR